MDLRKTIQELYAQKEKMEHVITLLEELQHAPSTPVSLTGKRRGRKSMPAKERAEVSERMKRYWESRRKEKP